MTTFINCSPKNSGIGRYMANIYPYLKNHIELIEFDYPNKKVRLNSSIISSGTSFPLNKYLWIYRNKNKIPKSDLYHLSSQYLSFLNLKPKVITCHDLLTFFHPDNILHQGIEKILFKGLKNATKIIAVSKNTKKDIINYYGIKENKIVVIYEGVDQKKFYPKNNKNQGYILHVSNEGPHKNFSLIIKSLRLLKEKGKIKNLKLLKAGNAFNNAYREKHLKLIKSFGLMDNVEFLDNVTDEKLADLYRRAGVFLYPSLYEGFGLPVLEAMSCGCPVIASNTSSLPEIVGNAGILINPYDINTLANLVENIFTQNNLRKEMIEKGLKQAEKFTWEKCAKETLDVYKSII